ncbi:VOC family protein [Croceicoccus ponticola]|uniref:VOC family protein n=1 Tax=Croceicoccus ponticola TaxID=2217664 RepID=A0A437H1N5_9SPHN|nr:VOC family protein [Croceicoccus ponticola]RVQ69540.1 VOC family protein [Croceicoccus ponticola]
MTGIARIEHVNISTSDAPRMAQLLERLCGWQRRWEGPSLNGGHTIHFGTKDQYIALYTPKDGIAAGFDKGLPLNHIGIEVDDIAMAEATIVAAGLEPFNHGDYAPGRRFYFFDWDGIEWEVVSYG